MKTDDFDYYLPEELIAQTPLANRSDSRLMLVDKNTGKIKHEHFFNIINYLNKGDVLVLNNTKVIPARIIGIKEETNAVIELLLLKELENDTWECLVKPARRIKVGTIVKFSDKLKCECVKVLDEGICHFKMIYSGILLEILDELGTMPLPPYIHEKLDDKNRYQTVYAKYSGSAAAPTAGLHFTKELLDKIEKKGVIVCYVTLHVGLGTFRPVKVSDVKEHNMHYEEYQITKDVCDILNKAKKDKRRIISVGTTTTNFHLPKSTLVMLVSAFASKDIILNAYNCAVKEKYRFFSFGDSMMLGDFEL